MPIGKEIPWKAPTMPKKCGVCGTVWHESAIRTCPLHDGPICLYCCRKKRCRHLIKDRHAAVWSCAKVQEKAKGAKTA